MCVFTVQIKLYQNTKVRDVFNRNLTKIVVNINNDFIDINRLMR